MGYSDGTAMKVGMGPIVSIYISSRPKSLSLLSLLLLLFAL